MNRWLGVFPFVYRGKTYYVIHVDNYKLLWKDGTVHASACSDNDREPYIGRWPGYWTSKTEAESHFKRWLKKLPKHKFAEIVTEMLTS